MIAHVWQSTLCALAAGAVALAFRRHRAAIRYRVWIAASLKFLFPFSWLTAFGVFLAQNEGVTKATVSVVAAAMPAAAVQRSVAVAAALQDLAAVGVTDQAIAPWAAPLTIVAAWMCGLLFIVVRSLWARCSVTRIIRSGTVLVEGREAALLRRVQRSSGPRPAVTLIAVDGAANPGVFGVLRPVLLWPRDMSARLADEHIEAIFEHELAHVSHRDNLWAALHTAVQAIFWFCPAVWWIGRQLIETREAACDEAVLARGAARDVYAAGILRACEFGTESTAWCVAGAGGRSLRQRMVRIMNDTERRRLSSWQLVSLVAIAGGALTTPVVYGLTEPVVQTRPAFALEPLATGASTWEITSATGSPAMVGVNARDLIRYAYGLHTPVVDGPDWIDTESYAMSAAADASDATDWAASIRAQLEGRFQLRAHVESRQMPVLGLRFDPSQHTDTNLRPALPCFDGEAWRAAGSPDGWLQGERQRLCGSSHPGPSGTSFTGVTMARLAAWLAPPAVARPVVDQTGLDGRFDIDLSFFPPAAAMIARSPVAAAALEPLGFTSVAGAMRDQLGLTLTNTEVPMDVLVIDRFERP